MLVVNKGPNVEESKRIIAKLLSKDRYPGNLEAAGSYWFPSLKNYSSIDFFTKDIWNKQISEDVLPYAYSSFATWVLIIYWSLVIGRPKAALTLATR